MPDQPEIPTSTPRPEDVKVPPSTLSPERVKAFIDFIEKLDKLYYEKPAGFAAYMATCQSHFSGHMRVSDVTPATEKPPDK